MSKSQLAPTNDVAQTLNRINDLYKQGQIKGFTIQIVTENDETISAHCGELSFLEKLGLIEMAKQDMTLSVNDLI